jgi:hypothetical protein
VTQPHIDQTRTPAEVARRALALFGAWGLSTNAPREDVLGWLEESGLRRELTQAELSFVDATSLTRQQRIKLGWHAERIAVLLWALGLLERLPDADVQCDTGIFQKLLPPFTDESPEAFVGRAELRPENELRTYAQSTFDLHSWARDAMRRNVPPRQPVNIEVVQERHHAINWVTGYEGLAWDEVTTDT